MLFAPGSSGIKLHLPKVLELAQFGNAVGEGQRVSVSLVQSGSRRGRPGQSRPSAALMLQLSASPRTCPLS